MTEYGDWILKAAAIDVRYWRLLHADFCPYCRVEWKDVPAAANVVPHWKGECKKAVEELRRQEDEKFLQECGITRLTPQP